MFPDTICREPDGAAKLLWVVYPEREWSSAKYTAYIKI